MLLWKFAKFLMPFLKAQVSFSSNVASIFSAIKQNSSILFSSNNIYFGQKQPIKVQVFLDFYGLGSKFVKFLMSILIWQVNSSSIFASFFIKAHIFSTSDKSMSSKSQFGDFQVFWWKFAEFFMWIFGNTSQFFGQKQPVKV